MSLRRRLLVICSVTVAAIVAFPQAALAQYEDLPPNVTYEPNDRWYGEWKFKNANEWTYALSTSGGHVSGTGYDNDTLRLFNGYVTDTSPGENICTYLTFSEPDGAQTWIACNGTVYFEHYDLTPGTYTFTIESKDAPHPPHQFYASARLIVPSTKNRPDLRAAGVGASWDYGGSPAGPKFKIVRPNAVILGNASFTVNRTVTMTTHTFACARTLLFDKGVEATRWEGCNTSGTVTVSAIAQFEVRSCLIEPVSINGLPGRPVPTKCVPLLVV